MATLSAGLIGCGFISHVYLRTCAAHGVQVAACADLDEERARGVAREHGIPRHCAVEELLNDPSIGVVVNLTPPSAHAGITLRALETGKHVYSEKPLATTREDGRKILDAAAAMGLRVECAPDTFFGNGATAARECIDRGTIGQPLAAAAAFLSHGNEGWHPDPTFFYWPGGGPLFDMGPYYLTVMIALLGPITRVTGLARTGFAQRTITSGPRRGEEIDVQVPTHYSALLEFAGGPVATLTTTWNVWTHSQPHVEIYGSEGTIRLPNPGYYVKPAHVRIREEGDWGEISPQPGMREEWRGIGAVDLIHALEEDRPHRASVNVAFHVLDVLCAIAESAESGQRVEIESSCERPRLEHHPTAQ